MDSRGHGSTLITTLAYEYPVDHVVPDHFHDRDQLVYACEGVMTVRTKDGMWMVPTHRAVWIPARIPHGITMWGRVSMRTIYLKPRLVSALPRSCCVVNVCPLLRELILHVCALQALNARRKTNAHLIRVLVDQLQSVEAIPLQLPNPSDARARRVATALSADASDKRPLDLFCKAAGASRRTIERVFQLETRMTLGKWRQQLRLMHAMRLLAAGEKITFAALEAGYNTPSAFISMFRKVLGTTPKKYFAGRS